MKLEMEIGILIIALLALLIFLTKHGIYYTLAVFIPLFPAFRMKIVGDIPFFFIDIILIIGLVKYLFLRIQESGKKVNFSIYGPALLLFTAIGLVSFAVGIVILDNPLLFSLYSFARMMLPLTCYLWGFRLLAQERRSIKAISAIFIASSSLMSLLGMGIMFQFKPVLAFTKMLSPMSDSLVELLTSKQLIGRLSYDMQPATAAGSLLLVSVLVIACIYAVKEKTSRKINIMIILALAINLVALILTFSRSAFAGLTVGFLFYVYNMSKYRKHKMLLGRTRMVVAMCVIVAVAIGINVVVYAIESGNPAATKYLAHFGIQGSELRYGKESRIERLRTAFHNMAEDPLLAATGSGVGTLIIGNRSGRELESMKYYAHNFFNVNIMYWGITGLLIFVLVLFSIWNKTRILIRQQWLVDSVDLALILLIQSLFPALFITFIGEIAFIYKPALYSFLWFIIGIGSCEVSMNQERLLCTK
jgi:hypothetical protein